MQVGVLIPEHEKKLIRESCGGCDHDNAEQANSASDLEVERAQLSPLLTAGEGGDENVSQQICQHDKDHGEAAKRAHFRNRTTLTREKADEENSDLSLETIENSIGGLAADETAHGCSIVGVLRGTKINYTRAVTAEEKILQKNHDRRYGDGDSSVEKNEGQQHKNRQSHDGADEIDALNDADIGTKSRNHAQHTDSELNGETDQNENG